MGLSSVRCVVRSAVAVMAVVGTGLSPVKDCFGDSKVAGEVVAAQVSPKAIEQSSKQSTVVSTTSAGSISTQRAEGANKITISTGEASPKYTVTRLSNPERLVIDFESKQILRGGPTTASGLEYVSSIRVGNHPDKTRVVVDLKGAKSVRHEARLDGGALTLVVAPLNVEPPNTTQSTVTTQPTLTTTSVKKAALTLDEEPVVSGSSAVDLVKVPVVDAKPIEKPVVTQLAAKQSTSQQAPQQPIALQATKEAAPVVSAPAITSDQTDRARLALPSKRSEEQKAEQSAKQVAAAPSAESKTTEAKNEQGAKDEVVTPETQRPALLTAGPAKDTTVAKPVAAQPKAQSAVVTTNIAQSTGAPATATQPAQQPQMPVQNVPVQNAPVQNVGAQTGTDTTSASAVAAKVVSVQLEGGDKNAPAIVIRFTGSVEHSMVRTAPSEYVVTLRDVAASAGILQQTLFAPRESSGIRSVRAVADGPNTLVRIFTQPSSYLTARRSDGVLRVEETQDLSQVARDIRAQMSPAAAKEAAKEAEGNKAAAVGKDVKDGDAKSKKSAENLNKPQAPQVEVTSDNTGEGELAAIKGSSSTYTGRLISLDLQDADIDSALRIIAEVSNLNIVAGDGVVGKVTLKLVDVPWDQALEVILKSHGLDKVLEGNVLRVAPVDKLRSERESFKQARVAEEELEPLNVKYMRVSYAKAAEIKSLVETVLSERGTVAFDERSNQLVVKDTRKGLQNVTELIKRIDLRTPQILLETQIIEANRNLSRQLGAELGFQYIQSPATGNGTGLNFPSAIAVGGSADPGNANSITGSAFPVASTASLGSAVTMLFDSADGTKSLALRLSQLEQEGQVRIISKPAVATTNNKAAEIKSVEKYRVKLPNGGLSIASGSGATSSGSGDVATQTIEAGIVLNVTPQASPDYYILLDIKAKSSSFGAKSVDGIPNEIERSASSSVLVSSGQTFALGGIYKINEQDRVSGMPFLKDIPVLGTLFRNTTTEQADEELLFFITPRIVEGSFEDATERVIS